jgi:sporulation protein YlmC with PRC-barrel domain
MATIASNQQGEPPMQSFKYVASCALLSGMTGYAVAQTTPPQPADIPSAAPTITTQPSSPSSLETTQSPEAPGTPTWYQRASDDWPASELIGSDVRNVAGETIGDVNEIIFANDGNVRAVVIGVGGFLGMGERDIAVSFKSLKIARDKNDREMIVVDATRDSLRSAPLWERRRTGG